MTKTASFGKTLVFPNNVIPRQQPFTDARRRARPATPGDDVAGDDCQSNVPPPGKPTATRAIDFPRRHAYSRLVTMPGCGTGYLPSASASNGAGPSMVSLSTSGANSWSQLSIWS